MKSALILLFIINFSYEEICHLDVGDKFIDLSSLNTSSTLKALKNGNDIANEFNTTDYYFNPCNDTKQIPNSNSSVNDCTNTGFSLCRLDSIIKITSSGNNSVKIEKQENYTLLAKAADGELSITDNIPFIKFKTTPWTIEVVCTPTGQNDETNFVLTGEKLMLYSPAACFQTHPQHSSHSVGAVLILILAIILLVYVIGGFFFKYFAYGARGVEAFPHYEFWTGLPGLVKDGITFLQNGCRPSQTQDSYESI